MCRGALKSIAVVVAVAIVGVTIVGGFGTHRVFAQDEAAPEASPTDWAPISEGDAERGAPPPSPTATPEASVAAPVVEAVPVATATPEPAIVSPAEGAAPMASTPAETPSPVAEAPAEGLPQPESTPTAGGAVLPYTPGRRSTISKIPHPEQVSPTPEETASPRARKPQAAEAPAKTGTDKSVVPENSPFAGLNVGNQKGPTNIKSDSLALDYQGKAILFSGHVHVVQAGGDLTSKTLRVLYGKDFNDIQRMIADGDVRIAQGTRWATGDHAVLDQTKHVVVLTGNPVVHDGEDQIAGSLITVDLVSGKSTVEHPRVVIFPKESKNTDNVDSPDHP